MGWATAGGHRGACPLAACLFGVLHVHGGLQQALCGRPYATVRWRGALVASSPSHGPRCPRRAVRPCGPPQRSFGPNSGGGPTQGRARRAGGSGGRQPGGSPLPSLFACIGHETRVAACPVMRCRGQRVPTFVACRAVSLETRCGASGTGADGVLTMVRVWNGSTCLFSSICAGEGAWGCVGAEGGRPAKAPDMALSSASSKGSNMSTFMQLEARASSVRRLRGDGAPAASRYGPEERPTGPPEPVPSG
jgi:hypothetical protein